MFCVVSLFLVLDSARLAFLIGFVLRAVLCLSSLSSPGALVYRPTFRGCGVCRPLFPSDSFLASLPMSPRRIRPSVLRVVAPWCLPHGLHVAFLSVCSLCRLSTLPLGFSAAGLIDSSAFPACRLFAVDALTFVGFHCPPPVSSFLLFVSDVCSFAACHVSSVYVSINSPSNRSSSSGSWFSYCSSPCASASLASSAFS